MSRRQTARAEQPWPTTSTRFSLARWRRRWCSTTWTMPKVVAMQRMDEVMDVVGHTLLGLAVASVVALDSPGHGPLTPLAGPGMP